MFVPIPNVRLLQWVRQPIAGDEVPIADVKCRAFRLLFWVRKNKKANSSKQKKTAGEKKQVMSE